MKRPNAGVSLFVQLMFSYVFMPVTFMMGIQIVAHQDPLLPADDDQFQVALKVCGCRGSSEDHRFLYTLLCNWTAGIGSFVFNQLAAYLIFLLPYRRTAEKNKTFDFKKHRGVNLCIPYNNKSGGQVEHIKTLSALWAPFRCYQRFIMC